MIDPALESWRRLSCAILLQAFDDAQAGDGPAYAWLATPQARRLVGLLELDPARLDQVRARMPEPAQPCLPGL
jgi:hypothetical protein